MQANIPTNAVAVTNIIRHKRKGIRFEYRLS